MRVTKRAEFCVSVVNFNARCVLWFPWKRRACVIWSFKLITVIIDICMCTMSEGNLDNKNCIIFLRFFFFMMRY